MVGVGGYTDRKKWVSAAQFSAILIEAAPPDSPETCKLSHEHMDLARRVHQIPEQLQIVTDRRSRWFPQNVSKEERISLREFGTEKERILGGACGPSDT